MITYNNNSNNSINLLNNYNDPLWFKDAVIYEVHVRSFFDSDGDGIGDFQGLKQKLSYIQDLGVNTIWLLPFFPSPLKDEGYDISDYTNVNPMYGTLDDFVEFLNEAHSRGIRVITELVLNHTSDQHEWFQRSRKAEPDSVWRKFYVWNDHPEKYKCTRIIFKDFEVSNWTWDHVAKSYYWHRFYYHQPDLNFDCPEVRQAMINIVEFWFNLGLDGLRLDAVPYLFEREGTNCENLPETHEFLKELRLHVDKKYKNKILLAEANQWPEDAIPYFGKGDECHMNFHFPLMPRLYMSLAMENKNPIIDILEQTPVIPDNCQWAIFLRNHDELTLEMVTDEERDFMYRKYASEKRARLNLGIRRRLAPLMENNRRKIELMNVLLLTLPGTPVLYYGDEIGMGDNIYLNDRDGVRTPMQWNPDRNGGFSKASPHQLYLPTITDPNYHFSFKNVELEQNNPSSLFNWMKDILFIRNKYLALGRGQIEFLDVEPQPVLAYIRTYKEEAILIVVNLSDNNQHINLDLYKYENEEPMELIYQNKFPKITKNPYTLTLTPFAYYMFSLKPPTQDRKKINVIPIIHFNGNINNIFDNITKDEIALILPNFLSQCRWFAGKGKTIKRVQVVDIGNDSGFGYNCFLTLIRVLYAQGLPDIYYLPIFVKPISEDQINTNLSDIIICFLRNNQNNEYWELFDASRDPNYHKELLKYQTKLSKTNLKGKNGYFFVTHNNHQDIIENEEIEGFFSKQVSSEQSNTSINYNNEHILKVFRKIDEGENPDVEVPKFLSEYTQFTNMPTFINSMQYKSRSGEIFNLTVLNKFIENKGTAWDYVIKNFTDFFSYIPSIPSIPSNEQPPTIDFTSSDIIERELPAILTTNYGLFFASIQRMAQITAKLHKNLSKGESGSSFCKEFFSLFDKRSLYQYLRTSIKNTFQNLKTNKHNYSSNVKPLLQKILSKENTILFQIKNLLNMNIACEKIRIHGDYHLGQILYTGNDFIIIDFEGEPSHSISERQLKRPALKDVAGIIRSFQYASEVALKNFLTNKEINNNSNIDVNELTKWNHFYLVWISTTFLTSYLSEVKNEHFIPDNKREIRMLLECYILDKVLYEIDYEINNRPDWLEIPLQGLAKFIEGDY